MRHDHCRRRYSSCRSRCLFPVFFHVPCLLDECSGSVSLCCAFVIAGLVPAVPCLCHCWACSCCLVPLSLPDPLRQSCLECYSHRGLREVLVACDDGGESPPAALEWYSLRRGEFRRVGAVDLRF